MTRRRPPTPPADIVIPLKLPGMASRIIMRDPASLKPFERNARIHSERQVAKICDSIVEFGFTVPLLIDAEHECEIIAGHGRQLAALKLQLKKVPTIDGGWMTEVQRRAYRIADNKLTLDSDWDDELLATELEELDALGFDLSLTGFTDGELRGLSIGGLGEGGDAPAQAAPPRWAVIVDCVDEADQVQLIERLEREGRRVRGAVG